MSVIASKSEERSQHRSAWAERGIVGRGILLDFDSWCTANDVAYDPYAGHPITLDQLEAVAESQATEIRFGDILFIRSGTKPNRKRLRSLK